mgnify:CR=1 FL=1
MRLTFIMAGLLLLAGCQSNPAKPDHHVAQVDLQRFMGDWFVIAHIPLPPEKQAWNAVESYRLDEQGRVQVTFRFRKGAADGPLKEYTPVAYVTEDPSNAIWDMQFLWPFRADFRVVWLDDDYSVTVIGRQKRDYAWIMARQPGIDEATYKRIVTYLASEGYDIDGLRRVPHQWQGTPGYQ